MGREVYLLLTACVVLLGCTKAILLDFREEREDNIGLNGLSNPCHSGLHSSNYELGRAIGERYNTSIKARLEALGPSLKKAEAYAGTSIGAANLASITNATKKAYPQYWDEMLGIAAGSKTELEKIILLNFRQELLIMAEQGQATSGVDDCSDVMLQYDKGEEQQPIALLGHNEDNSNDTVGTSYFVFASMSDGIKWAAFTYAGELSTAAWGWNNFGVCFTLNAVYANEVNTEGVGRNFVSRSLLDARNLEEAIERIRVPNQATGHNINVIGLDERKITTVETGPGNKSDVKTIANESYFHANAFLRLDIPQSPGPSSHHREKRASALPVPHNRKDILTILGDTDDQEYPIWRSGSDNEYTLVTSLFDLYQETVEIIYGNPKAQFKTVAVADDRTCHRVWASNQSAVRQADAFCENIDYDVVHMGGQGQQQTWQEDQPRNLRKGRHWRSQKPEAGRGVGYSLTAYAQELETHSRSVQDSPSRQEQPAARRAFNRRPLKDVIAELEWVKPREQSNFHLPEAEVHTSSWREAGEAGKPWVIDPPGQKTLIKNRFLVEGYWTSSESGDEGIDSAGEKEMQHEVY